MNEVIGIKETNTNLISYLKTDQKFAIGDMLLVDGGKGEYIYECVRSNEVYNPKAHKLVMANNIRVASSQELLTYIENQDTDAYKQVFKAMCKELGVNASIIEVDCSLDGNHLKYTYFSLEKLHFPKLIKYLLMNNPQRKKIEFYQVGEREYYAINGGIGVCGYELCCHSRSYHTPTITTNSLTSLGINVALKKTLTGSCGKYKCCLLFDPSQKQDLIENLPDIDQEINYLGETVVVTQIDLEKGQVTVLGSELKVIEFDYFIEGNKC